MHESENDELLAEYARNKSDEASASMATTWAQMAPLLDVAMGHLGNRERDALILHLFEGKSLKEVGHALGASEDVAQKKVARAVKKLQNFLPNATLPFPKKTSRTSF